MATARFTAACRALVVAWCAQAGFAIGGVVAGVPSWGEIAGRPAATAPLAPGAAIPWLIPVPVIGLAIAALMGPAPWN